jgi:hypothetical protein
MKSGISKQRGFGRCACRLRAAVSPFRRIDQDSAVLSFSCLNASISARFQDVPVPLLQFLGLHHARPALRVRALYEPRPGLPAVEPKRRVSHPFRRAPAGAEGPRDRPREAYPQDDSGGGADASHDRDLADLFSPCALPLGQVLQVRARRIHSLHGVRENLAASF